MSLSHPRDHSGVSSIPHTISSSNLVLTCLSKVLLRVTFHQDAQPNLRRDLHLCNLLRGGVRSNELHSYFGWQCILPRCVRPCPAVPVYTGNSIPNVGLFVWNVWRTSSRDPWLCQPHTASLQCVQPAQ